MQGSHYVGERAHSSLNMISSAIQGSWESKTSTWGWWIPDRSCRRLTVLHRLETSISGGIGYLCLGKRIMAFNHHGQLGGKGSDSPSKKAESFQIAPTYTYECLTMPSIRLPSQLGRRGGNHSICLLAYST